MSSPFSDLGHSPTTPAPGNDANGRAYNRTSFLPQRREMMQKWADYLDGLKADTQGTVLAFRQRGMK